jgi:hypothetical protein
MAKPGATHPIVGYVIRGPDNGTYMFDERAESCRACGSRRDLLATNPRYAFPRRSKLDVSTTYDGQLIVSSRFKEWVDRAGLEGAVFHPFQDDPRHFHLLSDRVLPFDTAARGTRFIGAICGECGQAAEVIGSDPTLLRVSGPIERGFARTDTVFGSYGAKHPLILVDVGTGKRLEAAKMRGLDLSPAYGTLLA